MIGPVRRGWSSGRGRNFHQAKFPVPTTHGQPGNGCHAHTICLDFGPIDSVSPAVPGKFYVVGIVFVRRFLGVLVRRRLLGGLEHGTERVDVERQLDTTFWCSGRFSYAAQQPLISISGRVRLPCDPFWVGPPANSAAPLLALPRRRTKAVACPSDFFLLLYIRHTTPNRPNHHNQHRSARPHPCVPRSAWHPL